MPTGYFMWHRDRFIWLLNCIFNMRLTWDYDWYVIANINNCDHTGHRKGGNHFADNHFTGSTFHRQMFSPALFRNYPFLVLICRWNVSVKWSGPHRKSMFTYLLSVFVVNVRISFYYLVTIFNEIYCM